MKHSGKIEIIDLFSRVDQLPQYSSEHHVEAGFMPALYLGRLYLGRFPQQGLPRKNPRAVLYVVTKLEMARR